MGSIALFIPVNRKQPANVVINGSVSCFVCGEEIWQAQVDDQEVFFATGRKGIYPAHVDHFYLPNPATAQLEVESPDYMSNLKMFATAYGIGEGMAIVRRG